MKRYIIELVFVEWVALFNMQVEVPMQIIYLSNKEPEFTDILMVSGLRDEAIIECEVYE